MILRSLRAHNYRNLAEVDIEFPLGVFGILGGNGYGKSSLLESIAWALYGHVASKTTKEDLLGSLAGDCSVQLSARLAGHDYVVERVLDRRTLATQASVRVDGQEVAKGSNEVSAYLAGELRMNYQNFLISSFARQNQLNALSSYQPAERVRAVLSMLGIGAVEEAIKRLREAERDYERELKARRAVLPNVAEIDRLIDELTEERRLAEKALETRVSEHEQASTALERAQAHLDRVSEQADDHARLSALLAGIDNRELELRGAEEAQAAAEGELNLVVEVLAEIEELIAKTSAHRPQYDTLRRVWEQRQALAGLRQQVAYLGIEIAEKEASERELLTREQQRDGLARQIETVELERASAERRQLQAESERASLRARREAVAGHRERLERQVEILQSPVLVGEDAARCPTCDQPVEDRTRLIEHLTAEIDQLDAEREKIMLDGRAAKSQSEEAALEIANHRTELASAQDRRAEADAAAGELRLLRGQLNARQTELANHQSSIAEIEALSFNSDHYQELLDEEDRLQELMQGRAKAEGRLESRALLEANRRRLDESRRTLDAERERRLSSMAGLDFDEQAHAASRQAHVAAQELRQATALSLLGAQNQIDRLSERLAREQRALAEHERITIEIERIVTERGQMALTREIVERFKLELIGRVRPALSLKLSALLADASGGAYSEAELDENYDILVYSGGRAHALRRYSGGEEALANLCLRLAISELINESAGQRETFLVLDEVLGSQDDERRDSVLKLLRTISGRFSQILMVNHIAALSDALPNAVVLDFDPLTRTSRALWRPPPGVARPS